MLKRFATKPQLFYLALLSFGINLGFAFQLSNLSSIFKFLGAAGEDLPLLWLVPPLTGLLIQPIIGQISDDTISRWGKRRPYIFCWGIFATLSFLILPFANTLIFALIFTLIIDCSLNGGAEGLRALTGDIIYKEEERSRAFAMQAFFSGVGGAIGTSLPYLIYKISKYFNINYKITSGEIPINIKISFFITSLILLSTLIIVMRKVKEKPYTHEQLLLKKRRNIKLVPRIVKTFQDLWSSLRKMSPRFRRICLIHGTSWMGIFIFWLYFTMMIAQNVYHLPSQSSMMGNNEYARLLQKATLDSSFYQSIYQNISIAYALFLYFIAAHASKLKTLHATSLFIGGISLALLCFESSSFAILLSICGIGIMWGSVAVLPYAIAMQMLPKGKIGTYMGIFNMSITAPQILCGLLLTPLYKYLFHGHANYLLFVAGMLIIVSGIFWIRSEQTRKPEVQSSQEESTELVKVN